MKTPICTCGVPVTAFDLQADCSRCNRILHAHCAAGHGEREYCEACAPPGVGRRVRENPLDWQNVMAMMGIKATAGVPGPAATVRPPEASGQINRQERCEMALKAAAALNRTWRTK